MKTAMAAALAATIGCTLTGGARGDLYTITFDDMPPLAPGKTEQIGFDLGPFAASVFASDIIGIGDPGYAGQVGIMATPDVEFAVYYYPIDRVWFQVNSVSALFATDASSEIDWGGTFSDINGNYAAGSSWAWDSRVTGSTTTLAYAPTGPAYAGALGIVELPGDGAQLLSVTLDADMGVGPPVTPEPSSAIPWCLAAGWGAFDARRRRRQPAARTR